jgi:hypothetical protein
MMKKPLPPLRKTMFGLAAARSFVAGALDGLLPYPSVVQVQTVDGRTGVLARRIVDRKVFVGVPGQVRLPSAATDLIR